MLTCIDAMLLKQKIEIPTCTHTGTFCATNSKCVHEMKLETKRSEIK